MSRYRGPRIKKVYRLGALPGLLQKEFKYRKGRDPKKKDFAIGKDRRNIVFV